MLDCFHDLGTIEVLKWLARGSDSGNANSFNKRLQIKSGPVALSNGNDFKIDLTSSALMKIELKQEFVFCIGVAGSDAFASSGLVCFVK